MSRVRAYLRSFLLALAMLSAGLGQEGSTLLSGYVSDPNGAALPLARVEARNLDTGVVYPAISTAVGSYTIPLIPPGKYEVRASCQGFEDTARYLTLATGAQSRLDIPLRVRTIVERMEVQGRPTDDGDATSSQVDLNNSDRSRVLGRAQIGNTLTIGRNYLTVIRTLPGVQVTTTPDSRGPNIAAPAIDGGQQGMILATVDGVGNWLSGTSVTGGYETPSVDAIEEINVLVGNYSAQYGSRNGGLLNVVVQAGTSRFHGTAYDYIRNEEFNANEWFNNATRQPIPRYRHQNPGGTLGGPVIIPGTGFNRIRTKLFFFYSEDYLHTTTTNAVSKFTMATAAERSGDFSQTVTTTGQLISITDPSTGNPLAGNLVPASRISPQGYALMNLFPLPNTVDPTGQRQYNFINQNSQSNPRDNRILRIDYPIGPRTTGYTRYIQDFSGNQGFGTTVGPTGAGWGQLPSFFNSTSWGLASTAIHTLKPNLVLETTWGINRGAQLGGALDAAQYRQDMLPALKGPGGTPIALPSLFPNANQANVIPNISFATLSPQSPGQAVVNPPSFGWGTYWPFFSYDTFQNVTSNLTWIKGRHQIKPGFYFERVSLGAPGAGSPAASMGEFWFGSDLANANDTGYAYSNLLAGTLQAAEQDNTRIKYVGVYNQYEWFIQDNLKVSKRITLDVGVRFQLPGPVTSSGTTFGVFDAADYSSAKAGQLLYPAIVNGAKVALNPITGAMYPFPRAASFDPMSYPQSGTPYSGIAEYKGSYFQWPGMGIGPRVGFAWDVFGDGKTALRGGFGIVYGRPSANGNQIAGQLAQEPQAFLSPQVFNTTFSALLSAPGFLSPQTVFTGPNSYPNPATYNWSFGLQRNIGKGFILDTAWVGNIAHHLFGTASDMNAVAPYTTWTPSFGTSAKYQDPTNVTGGLYNASLIRVLSGGYAYNNINAFTSLGESNYNSLQVQINKRVGRRFQMGTNYTWSKTLTFFHQQWVSDELTKNVAPSVRPQAVNLNFGYRIPDGSKLWNNAITRQIADGWNLNGVGAFFGGTPMTVSCSATNVSANLGNYWTGTPTGGVPFRCQMNGSLWLSSGATPASVGSTADPRLWYPFAAANFVLPSPTSLGIGNTPPTLTYGPGFENWDLSLSKDFRLGSEKRVLEIRMETFNTLNHFNPANPNSSLIYNFVTRAQTNASFGAIGSAQNNSRHSDFSLRFRF